MIRTLALLGTLALVGCADGITMEDADAEVDAPSVPIEGSPEAVQRRTMGPLLSPGAVPASAEDELSLAWAHRPEAERWTEATLVALRDHGAALPATEPANIEAWCPAYEEASLEDREAFWAGLLSALALHESTHRPEAVGGDGRWFGLTQISPATAKSYGCDARSGSALQNGSANLSCAVRILATKVRGDLSVRRIASDWGPFQSGPKREEMRVWVAAQPFCEG